MKKFVTSVRQDSNTTCVVVEEKATRGHNDYQNSISVTSWDLVGSVTEERVGDTN